MNVAGVFLSFYFGRNPQVLFSSVLLFVDSSRFINNFYYEFGKMFVARIVLSHAFKKFYTNATEQMTSNGFSADFSHTLDFEPWLNTRNPCVYLKT